VTPREPLAEEPRPSPPRHRGYGAKIEQGGGRSCQKPTEPTPASQSAVVPMPASPLQKDPAGRRDVRQYLAHSLELGLAADEHTGLPPLDPDFH
jgi:hypothetical protein